MHRMLKTIHRYGMDLVECFAHDGRYASQP